MRKLLVTAIAALFVTASFAQKIQVSESNESFSTGNQNALVVTIYGADKDQVEKSFKKFLKDMNGNVKMRKEIFADDCKIKKLGDNTFDVYAHIEESKDGIKVAAAFDIGFGTYLNSREHKEQYQYIRDEMYEFAVETTKEAIGDELDEQEDILKEMVKTKEDLEKDVKKLKKDIEDYKEKIKEAEEEIKENEKKKEEKIKEIGEQEKVVEEVKAKQKAVK